MKKRIAIMFVFLFFIIVPTVVSQPSSGYSDGMDRDGIAPFAHNPLLMLVAYDEEIASNTYDWFGHDIDGSLYVEYQTRRAIWRFPTPLKIHRIIQWDSNDTNDLYQGVIELQEDIGWNREGLFYQGQWVSILVGWTGQDNDYLGGVAHYGHACCLNKIQVCWTDDNTPEHEIGHLFGIKTHCSDGSCVMSNATAFYSWISENLRPIETTTVNWIPVWSNQEVSSISHSFCDECFNALLSYPFIGEFESYDSDMIFTDNEVNETGSPDGKEEINPTHPEIPYIIGFGIGIALIVVVAVYAYTRLHKKLMRDKKRED